MGLLWRQALVALGAETWQHGWLWRRVTMRMAPRLEWEAFLGHCSKGTGKVSQHQPGGTAAWTVEDELGGRASLSGSGLNYMGRESWGRKGKKVHILVCLSLEILKYFHRPMMVFDKPSWWRKMDGHHILNPSVVVVIGHTSVLPVRKDNK